MSDPFLICHLEMSSEHLNLFKVCKASTRIPTGGNEKVTDFSKTIRYRFKNKKKDDYQIYGHS